MFVLEQIQSIDAMGNVTLSPGGEYADLGVIGVNQPQRSREARIVTHNLNNQRFVNRWLGRSPVTWQMTGEFETNLLRQAVRSGQNILTPNIRDYMGMSVEPMAVYTQLDTWTRNGALVRVKQTAGNYVLGVARVQRVGESGDVLGYQTMSTRWQMTLLFEYGGGEVAADKGTGDIRAANTTIGVTGVIDLPLGPPAGPGAPPNIITGGGTGPGVVTIPTGPTVPGTQVPGRDPFEIYIFTTPPDYQVNIPYHQHITSVLLERTTTMTVPIPMPPGGFPMGAPTTRMVMTRHPLEGTHLMVDIPHVLGGPGFGYWIWIERWNGRHGRTSATAKLWDPLFPTQVWTWYDSVIGTNNEVDGHLYDIGPGMEGEWWWLRARFVYGTDRNLADGMPPEPNNPREGETYEDSRISNILGIYWGDYEATGNDGTEITFPPGITEPDEGLPEPEPTEARVNMQEVYYYVPVEGTVIHRGGPLSPFQPMRHPDEGETLRARAVRTGGASVYEIDFGVIPVFQYLFNFRGAANPFTAQANLEAYDVTLQEYKFADGEWQDQSNVLWRGSGGNRSTRTQNIINPAFLGTTLTNVTSVSRVAEHFTAARLASDDTDEATQRLVYWYRFKFVQGADPAANDPGDTFYTPMVGIVYPDHAGMAFSGPPGYQLDPDP